MRNSQIFIQNIDLDYAKEVFSKISFENKIFCYKKNTETQSVEPYMCFEKLDDIFDKKIFKLEIQKIEFDSLNLLLHCKNDNNHIYYLRQFKNNPCVKRKREQIINRETPLEESKISTYFKSIRTELIQNNIIHKQAYKNTNEYKKTDKIKVNLFPKHKNKTIDIIIKDKEFLVISKENYNIEKEILENIKTIFFETKKHSFNSDFIFGYSKNIQQKITFKIEGNLYLNAKFSFVFSNNAMQYKIIKKDSYHYDILKEIINKFFDFLPIYLKTEQKNG